MLIYELYRTEFWFLIKNMFLKSLVTKIKLNTAKPT